MGDEKKSTDSGDPRVYFAAERTLLAWIRTGLAMMGFGFVVARFGLLLQEIAAVHPNSQVAQHGISLWMGMTLVVLGVLVNVAATFQNWRTIRCLETEKPLRFHPLSLGGLVALAVAILGVVMAVYLLFGLTPAQ